MLMAIFVYFLRRVERERCGMMVDVLVFGKHQQRKCLQPALPRFYIPICRQCAVTHELIDDDTKRLLARGL